MIFSLTQSHTDVDGCGRLLAAVMEALCHPTVKLTSIMPINCEPEMQQLLNKQYAAGKYSFLLAR